MIDAAKLRDAQLRDLVYALGGDTADLPFWEGCAQGQFLLHRCALCERHYWPASRCVDHGDQAMAWVPGSGKGTVHVWTVQHKAHNPDWRDLGPYIVAVLKLAEGPYFHAHVIDCPPGEMRTGMAVELAFRAHPNGMTVPVFKRQD